MATLPIVYKSYNPGTSSPFSKVSSSPSSEYDYLALAEKYNNEARNWSAKQAERQMQFQYDMSSTAHQREVADLQAAGLNPVLSAGGQGAASGAGAAAQDPGLLNGVVNNLMNVVQQQNDLNFRREQLDRQEKLDRERFELERSKFDFDSSLDREKLDFEKLKYQLDSQLKNAALDLGALRGGTGRTRTKDGERVYSSGEAESDLFNGLGNEIGDALTDLLPIPYAAKRLIKKYNDDFWNNGLNELASSGKSESYTASLKDNSKYYPGIGDYDYSYGELHQYDKKGKEQNSKIMNLWNKFAKS